MLTFRRHVPLLASLLVPCLAAACGSGNHTRTPVLTDSGTDAGAVQDSGAGGKTGTGGNPSTGGKPSTGGAPAAGGSGTGGAVPDASPPVPEASVPIEAAVEAAADTGSPIKPVVCASDPGLDGGAQWLDYSTNSCKACPASPPDTDGMTLAYDPSTHILVARVLPGLDQITSAETDGSYTNDTDAGPAYSTFTAVGVVKGNTLTFDLSAQFTNRTSHLDGVYFLLSDACGNTGVDTSRNCVIFFANSGTGTDAGLWQFQTANNCL